MNSPYGHPSTTVTSGTPARLRASFATVAALAALAAGDGRRTHGVVVTVDADGSQWMFHSTSTAADTSNNLVVTPGAGSGRWLRMPGDVDLSLPFTFATADAAVLLTVPVGARMLVRRGYWDIDTDLTGGSSSAIGLSSSATGFTTKGDLLGGAGGDVLATLAAGKALGTIGAKTAAGILLPAAATIRFDRITSVFTAGGGRARLSAHLLINPGA